MLSVLLLTIHFVFSFEFCIAQISRTQIISNASTYVNHTWTAKSCNLWNGTYCSGANIYKAPWVTSARTYTSIPYCWGGWSSITEFNTAITNCKSAGQVCSTLGGGCVDGNFPSAPLSCAAGLDCSGLVTRAWELTSKYSTSTLPNISSRINLSSVQPGDILNIAGHVRLVSKREADGSITVIESSGTDYKTAYHNYTAAKLASYDPRCPNSNIVTGGSESVTAPSNDNPCDAGTPTLTVSTSCSFTSGTNVGATNSSIPNVTCDGTSNGDVWYKFKVPSSGKVIIETNAGTINDMGMVLYTGSSCSSLSYYGCYANGSTYSQYMPRAELTGLTPNATMWIRLYEYNNNSFGTFNICVTGASSSNCSITSIKPSSETRNPESYSTTPGADDFIVTGQANCTFSVSESCSWLTVTPSSGTMNSVGQVLLNYSVQENSSTSSRSCTVTVNGSTFTIKQNGCSADFSRGTKIIEASGSTYNLDIDSYSPCSWNIQNNNSWVHLSETSGTGSPTISVTVDSNTSTETRTATLTIEPGNETHVITQQGIITSLSVNPTSVTLKSTSNSSDQFNVTSNVSWTVSDDATWLSVTPTNGSNDETITVTATSANPSNNTRSGIVTITGNGITRTVTVTQDGTPIPPSLTVNPTSLTLGSASNSTDQINVTSNGNWTVSDDVAWLTVSPASGSNNETVTVTATSANTLTTSRIGTVTISGSGITRTIAITQNGTPITPSLTVNPTSLTLGSALNSSDQINVTSNVSWTASDDAPWLTVSPASGSNNETVKVTAISANTSTTSRSGTVTITGGEITRTVSVTQPKDCAPDWQNPVGKQYTMGVYAQIKIDDVINCTAGAIVGAFKGNECLGIASLINGPGGCQFNLLLGSNTQNISGIQLKLWDPTTCDIHELAPLFDFANDGNLGTISKPELFTNKIIVTQQIPLVKGWNWISFNVIPEINTLADVLNYNKTNEDILKTSTNLGGQATYYDGVWYVDKGVLWGVGYKLFVKSDNPGSINVKGTPAPLGPINLTKDWNWLGYCPQMELDADIALKGGLWKDENVLKTSPDKGGQATYYDNKWWGPGYIMKPGLGYLIKINEPSTLTYNGSGTKSISDIVDGIEISGWENPGGFENTMGAHVQITYNNKLITSENAFIGAFKNGECVGAAKVYNGPADKQFQLSIASNFENQEGIVLKYYDSQSDRTYELDKNFKFQKDMVLGTIANPIVYNISDKNIIEELVQSPMVYPNPFEDELNFEFRLFESQNVTIDLFDVTGKLVAKILNNKLEKGKHKITWQTNDAKNGQLNSGIYVSIIKTADATYTKKVILSKNK